MFFMATLQALAHALSALPLDDNSVRVLALLGGGIGGFALTGFWQQLRAKRVKAPRKPPDQPRRRP